MILLTISRDFYPGYLVKRVLIFLIRIYKLFLSPLFPSSCRFTPTCSEYSIDAITKYGIIRGFYISLRRVLRCHPFRPGGYDPVK